VARSESRSGQAGNSLTWLFALIGGGTILLIFYQVATTQLDSAEDLQAQQRIDRLSNTINALQSSPNTNRSLPALRAAYNVTCRNGDLYVSNTQGSTILTDHPVYTPGIIPDRGLNAVTTELNAPMPITTILYIIPQGTTIPEPDTGALPDILQPFSTTSTESSDYPQSELKAGEFLSDNEITTCTQAKIYNQAKLSYETLQHKATRLITTTPNRCNDSYTAANNTLQTLQNTLKGNIDNNAYNIIIQNLREQNQGLSADSCPTLY
jgi:hypothetical protein